MTTKTLKQSIADWSYYDAEIPPVEFYPQIKAMGYEAVEMAPAERRQAVIDAGLINLDMSGPGMQVGLNRLENHPQLIKDITTAIDTAAAESIPYVIIFSGNRDGQSDNEGIENCLTAIKQFIGYAEDKGVTLLFEMLNSYDHDDYQAASSSYGFKVAKAIDSPNLKVLYDIYHMFRMGEDVVKDIQENTDLIGHIHLAGSPTRNCIADDNEIDHKAVLAAVKQTSYNGYLGQEFLVNGDRFDELKRAFAVADEA